MARKEQINPLFLRAVSIVITALLLAGCAGKNFERPPLESFVLGKTTKEDVIAKLGKPLRVGKLNVNGVELESNTYAYASMGSEAAHPGVTPGRGEDFFYDDHSVLVGTVFRSSFKADGTDFDETKIAQITKGRSTRVDVVQLMGPPHGEYIYPLIKGRNDHALVYSYNQVSGSAFKMKVYVKLLVVSYDTAGVVTDVEYTASGEKD